MRSKQEKTGAAMLPLPLDEGRVKRRVFAMSVGIAPFGLPPHSATDGVAALLYLCGLDIHPLQHTAFAICATFSIRK